MAGVSPPLLPSAAAAVGDDCLGFWASASSEPPEGRAPQAMADGGGRRREEEGWWISTRQKMMLYPEGTHDGAKEPKRGFQNLTKPQGYRDIAGVLYQRDGLPTPRIGNFAHFFFRVPAELASFACPPLRGFRYSRSPNQMTGFHALVSVLDNLQGESVWSHNQTAGRACFVRRARDSLYGVHCIQGRTNGEA